MHVSVMYVLPLISGNGVKYNQFSAICCDGVLTYENYPGICKSSCGSLNKLACCGTQPYSQQNGLCCDGTLNTDLSYYAGDTCPSAPGL